MLPDSNRTIPPTRVGLFGVGLDTYWPQFPGLRDRLIGYQKQIAGYLGGTGLKVIDAGLVDSPEKVAAAIELFRQQEVELIFLYISTYALSSTVLPLAQRVKVPFVILNLQPTAQLDYEAFNRLGDRGTMTGAWLEYCQSCSAPEMAAVFNRSGIPYHLITGYLDEAEARQELADYCSAIQVVTALRSNRVGILGHYYNGMLDVYSDMTLLASVFGGHFELLEMDDLHLLRETVTNDEIATKINEFQKLFEVSPQCAPEEIERAAKTSLALDTLVNKHRLGALAYYYEGGENSPFRNIVTSIIAGNTLLTGRHVPVAGECEIKNVLAMKIMDLLGAGGSFSEFYLTDFKDDVVYLGHDGPAHFAIAENRVGLVPLSVYHGKPGKGLSIQMTVKHGPVTLLSVVHGAHGKISFLVAEAESVPGPILQIGNTNSRYRFSIGAKAFLNRWTKAGPAHHCAIGIGLLGQKLEKVASLLGIEIEKVCSGLSR